VLRSAATFSNDLLKIRGDRVGEPSKDDGVHHSPPRIASEDVVGLDVVSESVPCQVHQQAPEA
jgi:hypothetical protein